MGILPVPATPDAPLAQHSGSCHCQKVQVELLVPLAEQEVKEDNCSSCVRVSRLEFSCTITRVRLTIYRQHISGYTPPETRLEFTEESTRLNTLVAVSMVVLLIAQPAASLFSVIYMAPRYLPLTRWHQRGANT